MADTAEELEGLGTIEQESSITHVIGSSIQDRSLNFNKDITTPISA